MKVKNILLTEKHLELLGEHQLKKTPCNNREIIVSDYWLSQKHRKIIGPDGLEK